MRRFNQAICVCVCVCWYVCQVGEVVGTAAAVKLKVFLLTGPAASVITSHISLC